MSSKPPAELRHGLSLNERTSDTDDQRIQDVTPLPPPEHLIRFFPIAGTPVEQLVGNTRGAIRRILQGQDDRLLVVIGPCSIHDPVAALEYARRLKAERERFKDTLEIVMRVYFEKPRTTVGWKGLINDPYLDESYRIHEGLRIARQLLVEINRLGVPAGSEFLDVISPQYIGDLISWGAIGARTTESQAHRELASGLSMPIGFKNGTDGNLQAAVNAMVAARTPQTFLGVDQEGYTCIVRTNGNPTGHLVLRGGKRPNYDPISITEARLGLIEHRLPEAIMVDCSHGNSWKKFQGQEMAWRSVLDQRIGGNDALIGLMLESHLFEGSQKFGGDPGKLLYGTSITDECISWDTTERLVLWAADKLAGAA